MLTQPINRIDLFFKKEWKRLLLVGGYATLIVLLDQYVPIRIPSYGGVILGTAISILLAFRTNAAYDRWWEARKVWGSIVNDSRNLARRVITQIADPEGGSPLGPASERVRQLVYRQIAWPWTLGRRLRGHDQLQDLERYLAPDELRRLGTSGNIPYHLMVTQSQQLKELADAGYLSEVLLLNLDKTVASLIDDQGKCERIKNTVFPQNYVGVLKWIITLFYLVIPLAVVEDLGWSTIFFVLVLGAVFQLIETIGDYVEKPLDDVLSGTPMYALSRTIEIDLLRELGETDLPEPITPQNGVLL